MAYTHQKDNSVYVDKEGVVHYDGDPTNGDEYEEIIKLAFHRLNQEKKRTYTLGLKNALYGRAWTLTHKRPEISVDKLLKDGTADAYQCLEAFI